MDNHDGELKDLLKACGTSSGKTFERLYQKSSPFLKHYALNILRCEALTEEVLQDSFIQIWKSADQYCAKKGKPLTWMCTIVRNKAIDKIRMEKKHLWFNNADKRLSEQECSSKLALPAQKDEQTRSTRDIKRQLECLSEKEKTAINLTYFYDYSRKDLAKATGSNINTVKSWISRGIKHLREFDEMAA
ncbi:RNA polymerase sigma factor [Ningiella sp. W23]|uniref:RNA polymerase sigma factor n=1 Tax=Ningiella sp. W23 TaxID=3023715 RepID=UPI0037568E4B